jgi:hypothetical protein
MAELYDHDLQHPGELKELRKLDTIHKIVGPKAKK